MQLYIITILVQHAHHTLHTHIYTCTLDTSHNSNFQYGHWWLWPFSNTRCVKTNEWSDFLSVAVILGVETLCMCAFRKPCLQGIQSWLAAEGRRHAESRRRIWWVCHGLCHCVLLIIIMMEICKAPTLRLKALNKHSITHNVHRDGNVTSNENYIYI